METTRDANKQNRSTREKSRTETLIYSESFSEEYKINFRENKQCKAV